jgi:hypothetical protein
MLEWPGRCHTCNELIGDWADAGLDDRGWVHKTCYAGALAEATQRGVELPPLRSPLERSKSLEWPMLVSILLFHFGVGIGFIGWIMLTQDTATSTDSLGFLLLAIGLITPLLGIAGVALNIIGRRRIELVRQALDLSGGWKPGR